MTRKFKIQHFIIILRQLAYILLMAGSIFLFSCSKDSTGPDLDYSKVYRIKTKKEYYRYDGHYNTYKYSYDSLGRILSLITIYPDHKNDTTSYTYNDPTSIIVDIRGGYVAEQTILIQLNEKGLMVKETSLKGNGYNTYEYNADGYCVKINKYRADTCYLTIFYQYRNDNLATVFQSPGEWILYQFYKDKINTLGNFNIGMAFKGKSSKNLRKVKNTSDYFDSLGRLKNRYTDDGYTEYVYDQD